MLEAVPSNDSSADPAALPATVGGWARRLHAQNSGGLTIDLPPGSKLDPATVAGAEVTDGVLRFATLAQRNQAVADEVLSQLGDAALQPVTLFDAAAGLLRHEFGQDDTASARLLAAVHRKSDVLAMAADALNAPGASGVTHALNRLHVLEGLLPHLESLNWSSLVALARAQYPRTRGDGAAGVFFDAVGVWLRAHPGTAAELTAAVLEMPDESVASLLEAAWLVWADEAPVAAALRALELGRDGDAPLQRVTAWVARKLLAEDKLPAEAANALVTLILRRLAGATAEERSLGLLAATQALPTRRNFDAILRERAQEGDPDTLAQLAYSLAQLRKEMLAAGLFFEWLPWCAGLPTTHTTALGQLDYALSELLSQSAHRDAVLDFLQGWIIRQEAGQDFAEVFDSCASQMREDPALLRRVITLWFLADSPQMPAAATAVIMALSPRARARFGGTAVVGVMFEPALLEQAEVADFLFLARRIIGFVFDADLLLTLALSMLQVADAKRRVHPLLDSLLGDEIGYDYPSTTVGRIDAALVDEKDPDNRAILQRIRDKLADYLAQLDALPRLRELQPPAALHRAFRRVHSAKMDESMSSAQRKSILSMFMANQVYLKAGNSTFHYLQGRFTEPMVLKPMSVTMELPRREILDPVGNAFRMHQNRSAKREAP